MVVVDVPVELADELVVFLDGVLDQAERVIAIDVLGDRADQVDLSRRDAGNLVGEALADAIVERVGFLGLFIADHEEQLVLDDRAREEAAILFGFKLKVDLLATGLAAGQAVVGVAVEGRTLESVTARTKDDVDRAALEIAF